jgi:hypothetical protein
MCDWHFIQVELEAGEEDTEDATLLKYLGSTRFKYECSRRECQAEGFT